MLLLTITGIWPHTIMDFFVQKVVIDCFNRLEVDGKTLRDFRIDTLRNSERIQYKYRFFGIFADFHFHYLQLANSLWLIVFSFCAFFRLLSQVALVY